MGYGFCMPNFCSFSILIYDEFVELGLRMISSGFGSMCLSIGPVYFLTDGVPE